MTPTASMTDHGPADGLRAAMVDGIARRHEALGRVLSADVRRALLTVPRHLFAEGDADLEGAYADQSIVTKRDERGVSVSSVSALSSVPVRRAVRGGSRPAYSRDREARMESYRPAGPGSTPASTLYDVAREAGVSTATVSRVVHGQDRVRPSTRRRVLEVIEALGDRKSVV